MPWDSTGDGNAWTQDGRLHKQASKADQTTRSWWKPQSQEASSARHASTRATAAALGPGRARLDFDGVDISASAKGGRAMQRDHLKRRLRHIQNCKGAIGDPHVSEPRFTVPSRLGQEYVHQGAHVQDSDAREATKPAHQEAHVQDNDAREASKLAQRLKIDVLQVASPKAARGLRMVAQHCGAAETGQLSLLTPKTRGRPAGRGRQDESAPRERTGEGRHKKHPASPHSSHGAFKFTGGFHHTTPSASTVAGKLAVAAGRAAPGPPPNPLHRSRSAGCRGRRGRSRPGPFHSGVAASCKSFHRQTYPFHGWRGLRERCLDKAQPQGG